MRNSFKQKYVVTMAMAGTLLLATLPAWVTRAREVFGEPAQFPLSRSDIQTREHNRSGRELFIRGEFGGNGRTCVTCHSLRTGDITLDHIQARFAENPLDPLFRAIDSDDGTGASYNRLLAHATFRVFVDLPSNIQLAEDSAASRVALFRSTLPTNNIALDPVIMWDGREPDLPHQALAALITHSEITLQPTALELLRIADFQKNLLFSSRELMNFADGGPPPALPEGRTASERRGRAFFIPTPGVVNCSLCHSGPMLNETLPSVPMQVPAGSRFTDTLVSALNRTGLPVRTYIVTRADGSRVNFTTSDPGRMLVTGDPADVNRFKQPTLWGIRSTAPYFHDNSAKTLSDVMEHYDFFMRRAGAQFGFPGFTAQDKADIVAFLKLL
jgi:cytochrome c peroxidase